MSLASMSKRSLSDMDADMIKSTNALNVMKISELLDNIKSVSKNS